MFKLFAISCLLFFNLQSFALDAKYPGEILSEKLSPTELAPKKDACRIFLIRHAKTDWNEQGKLQGWNDVPLNENGKKEAEQLAQKFAAIQVDAIYSSVLSRAKDTAEAIALYHPQAELIYDASLRFYNPQKKYNADPKDLPAINAEIAQEIIKSATAYLKQLSEKHRGQNVIILTHGKVIKCLLSSLSHLGIQSIQIENGAMIRVIGSPEGLSLEKDSS